MAALPVKQDRVQELLEAFAEDLRCTYQDVDLPTSVRKALDYIHDHLFEPSLNASIVCIECNLNNHNISSRFKYHLDTGMRQYIEIGRLEAAKMLLALQGLNILQIAWSVGYTYPETFARAFKRYTGYTASAYRKEMCRRHPPPARNGDAPRPG